MILRTRLFLTAAALVVASVSNAAVVADLAGDFGTATNPNGLWSYGYSTLGNGSAFLLYDSNTNVAATYGPNTATGWSSSVSPTGIYPYVATNVANWNFGSASFTAGTIIMHPGNEATHLYSVSRYTAGTNLGYVRLDALFQRLESAGSSSYGIYRNGSLVAGWGGTLTGVGATFGPANTYLTLNSGDMLDIVVGPGNDSYGGDVNMVAATLTTVPGPGAALAFGVGLLRRRRRQA